MPRHTIPLQRPAGQAMQAGDCAAAAGITFLGPLKIAGLEPGALRMLLSIMAKHDPDLSLIFHALSDPTRRAILERLARGPAPVSELAAPTGLRLPTVMRHLSVMEAAGLVTSAKDGRVRSCALAPAALAPVRDWIETQRAVWETRLDRLEDYVEKLMKDGADGN